MLFALNSSWSDIKIGTPAYFWFSFAKYVSVHTLIFSPSYLLGVFLYVENIVVGFASYFHCENIFVLIGEFSSFILIKVLCIPSHFLLCFLFILLLLPYGLCVLFKSFLSCVSFDNLENLNFCSKVTFLNLIV